MCPRCRAPFEEPPESCPNCAFNLAVSAESFPFAPPPLEFVMNPAGLLPAEAAEAARERYEAFCARFPAIRLSFCFIQLAPGTPLSEFSFWLFNSAPAADDSRAWQILLTVDLAAGQMSLNNGYAIEPFIDPKAWHAALNHCAASCAGADWSGALVGFIDEADQLLQSAWTRADAKQKETGTSS